MKLILLFFYLFLFSFIWADCPSNCSNHGVCSGGSCQCSFGWAGTDCSFEVKSVTSGVKYSNNLVNDSSWYFFTIQVSGGRTLEIQVNQTGSTGDCDEYVQINNYPTLSDFYARDLSTEAQVVMRLNNLNAGLWYIGVFGFSRCTFDFRATVTGGCPNDCSGHGACENGVCNCESGYSGVDCSLTVSDIQLGQQVSGHVNSGKFNTYRLNFQRGDQLKLILHQTVSNEDCDLYLRYGSEPTLRDFDYRNISVEEYSTITIDNAAYGNWYIGVFGFTECTYTLLATTAVTCPNNCSFHGNCVVNAASCVCESGWNGPYCGEMLEELRAEVPVRGFVNNNLWNYFHYTSNTVDNLKITIEQQEANQDCDLYVLAGQKPDQFNYDYQDIGYEKTFSIEIPDAGHTIWYFGVYGFKLCNYTIVVSETDQCLNNCNGNGQCVNGICQCNSGWEGEACEKASNSLTNGVVLKNQKVRRNEWNYFTISVQDTSSVHILVKETSSTGFVWVYVAKTTPDLRNYEYSDTETNTNTHRINIEFNEDQQVSYVIGVYGDPFAPLSADVAFDIVVYSPPFLRRDLLI